MFVRGGARGLGMSEMRSRFLDLVSQGYGDDLEMKYAARSLLESQVVDDGEKMARAVERMQAAHGRRKWLGWLVPLVLVLLGLSVFVLQAYPCYRFSKLVRGDGIFGFLVLSNDPGDWRGYSKELTEDEKLLLFGDAACADEVGRKKGFWDVEPGNAGAYIEYLAAYRMERGKYPGDMLETAAEIDAGNAFYYLLRAGEMAGDCTKKVSPARSRSVRGTSRRGRRGKLDPKVKSPVSGTTPPVTTPVARKHVEITDAAKHREAMSLLEKAVGMKGLRVLRQSPIWPDNMAVNG